MNNTILDHVLTVVCKSYKVSRDDMTAKQDAGRGGNDDITKARGAYMFISSEIGISGVVASKYIALNKGNASTYRTKFILKTDDVLKQRLKIAFSRKLK
jgi:hypothetical protein